MTAERLVGIATFVVVVAGLAIGFGAIGPPQHMRLIELDNRRVSDLQSIESRLRYDDQGRRSDAAAQAPKQAADDWPRDPDTRKPYGYQRESAKRFRLCATFALPSDADVNDVPSRWRHGAGPTCFRRDLTSSTGLPEQDRIIRAL